MTAGRKRSDASLHVMMVTDFYWPHLGGVEQHVRSLSQALVDRAHRVTVITTRTAGTAAVEMDGRVEVRRITTGAQRLPRLFDQQRPWAPPVADPVVSRILRHLVRELRPDVVHGHDWLARSALPAVSGGPPFVSSLHYYTLSCARKDLLRYGRPCDGPALWKCTACSVDHYGPLRGVPIALGATVGRRREEKATARFIAVSRATAFGNGLDPDDRRNVVIPNFLPPERPDDPTVDIDSLLAALPPDGFFVYVGDFRATKGYDLLLDAYADLDTERPLVVIGKRWPTTPPSLPSGVMVLEQWPNAAVLGAFDRAGIAIVPSQWAEPFGIVAIEAMRGGCPVIASATGGLVDIVGHERTGLLVEQGSQPALVAAMRRLDIDDELRVRLGEQGRSEVGKFTAERVVPLIEDVYRTAIEP